ncbi:MAG: transposase [Gemmatimonadota bacterium]|nr:transposase [Gemmatimonadota bacterium]
MHKQSASRSQPDLFSNFESHITPRKQARLNDAKSWHNLFYQHLTSAIDEDVFSVLFDAQIRRPNAPIRQLFAMMIMKEGFGWSDAQLFDECRFNVLAMRALGLMNLSDEAPVESTYYQFQRALYAYQLKTGRDLVGETFASLTRKQATAFGVLGQQIRMDSKLIGSNIALCCRLQLVVRCIQRFWGSLDEARKGRFSSKDRQVLDGMLKVKPHQVADRLARAEKGEKLQEFGVLLSRLQATYTEQDSDYYGEMARVFRDQYTVLSSSKQVLPKPPDEISAYSLQWLAGNPMTFHL